MTSSPTRCQYNTCTDADLLSIGALRRNFGEVWIKIQKLSFEENLLKMSFARYLLYCPGEYRFKKNNCSITLTYHKVYGISIHRKCALLFHSLFRRSTQQHPIISISSQQNCANILWIIIMALFPGDLLMRHVICHHFFTQWHVPAQSQISA